MTKTEYTQANVDLSIYANDFSIATSTGEMKVDHVSTEIHQGEFVAIHGQSGAGKTLFATALCGIRFIEARQPSKIESSIRRTMRSVAEAGRIPLQEPESSIKYSGKISYALTDRDTNWQTQLSSDYNIRSQHIGFVPQAAILDGSLTAEQNVLIPARMNQTLVDQDELDVVYETLRIQHLLKSKAGVLSGGEAQRVAIARSLAKSPNAIVLDEPTSGLDPENKLETNKMLYDLCTRLGKTVISVTHEQSLATRWIEMDKGRIISDTTATE